MRRFNVTGVCVPGKHYMVDISGKLAKIKEMVDYGDYFTINRARQYGKTTTLSLLKKMLSNEYTVISISFEGLGDESFDSSTAFCRVFMESIQRALKFTDVSDDYRESWLNDNVTNFNELSNHITEMCKDKELVLMIDEVDKTSNNRTFLHFLGILRDKYLKMAQNEDYTFHSVILAGVYDVKNIKLKMINEGAYIPAATENRLGVSKNPNLGVALPTQNAHLQGANSAFGLAASLDLGVFRDSQLYNSLWNIAADFKVDMSFDPSEITTMLAEHEADRNTGMDIPLVADEIHNYTN